jgi:hypothetical protein
MSLTRRLSIPLRIIYLQAEPNKMRIFLFILCLGYLTASAQEDHLVTLKGDTLRGKIQLHSYDLMDRVSVRVNNKKKMFTALEVRYVFSDSARYTAVQYENMILLMRVIKSGYLSLYAFKFPEKNSYDGRFLVKMNGAKMEVPNLQFSKIVSKFLNDCDGTVQAIESNDWGRSDIEAIVDNYNACIKEKNRLAVMANATASPLTEAVGALRTKVSDSPLETKKDVLDLLTSIDNKERMNEPVPGYLKEGLKSYLADKKEFEAELNKVLELLK